MKLCSQAFVMRMELTTRTRPCEGHLPSGRKKSQAFAIGQTQLVVSSIFVTRLVRFEPLDIIELSVHHPVVLVVVFSCHIFRDVNV